MTADAERLGYRGQGSGCGLTTYRTGGDPDDQRAVVLAADADMSRSGSDPDGDAHCTSVPGFGDLPPVGRRRPREAPESPAHAAVSVDKPAMASVTAR